MSQSALPESEEEKRIMTFLLILINEHSSNIGFYLADL